MISAEEELVDFFCASLSVPTFDTVEEVEGEWRSGVDDVLHRGECRVLPPPVAPAEPS